MNRSGSAARVVREAEVYKEPTLKAQSYGVLPVDTLLTLKGQRKGNFLAVEVELEDSVIDGWIERDALDIKEEEEKLPDASPEPKKPLYEKGKPQSRPHSRLSVPKDEGLLLRRDPTFFYGLQAGGGMAIMQDSAANQYYGPAITAGAHAGYFLLPSLPVHVEGNYSLLIGNATTSSTTVPVGTNVQFGFFDMAAHVRYFIQNIELHGFAQYSVGLSVNNIPTTIPIGAPINLSTAWVGGGIGYQFPANDVLDLGIKARYAYSFMRYPIGFQVIWLNFYLQFRG